MMMMMMMDMLSEYRWGIFRLDVVVALLFVKFAPAVLYRIYRLFIYPYFVSPLRDLPGPKVRVNPALFPVGQS